MFILIVFDIYSLDFYFNVYLLYVAYVNYFIKRIWYGMVWYLVVAFIYSVSQKNPHYGFLKFFPKRLGIFNQFLDTYYKFISTLDYKFLFKYLQLWQDYAVGLGLLSATT